MSKQGSGRGALMERIISERREKEARARGESLAPGEAPSVPSTASPTSQEPPRTSGRGLIFAKIAEKSLATKSVVTCTEPEPPAPKTFGRGSLLATVASRAKELSSPPKTSPSVESVPSSQDLAKLKISDDLDQPPVVMMGGSGQSLNFTCNYIRLEFEKGRGLYQYHVEFHPEVDARNVRFNLLRQLKDIIGEKKTFDGAILYLPIKLRDEVTIATAKMPTDESPVSVKIKFVRELNMGHEQVIHLFNVLFKRIMLTLGLLLHGRHYYDPGATKDIPAFKLEVWPGYVVAIHEYEGGVMLCCDASHRVLRTNTVHQLMDELMQTDQANWQQHFCNQVVGQTVLTRYNNKTYTVDDVDFKSSPKAEFTLRDGEKVSYCDYYKKQYNINIKDRAQPLLKSMPKAKIRGEEVTQIIDLIPELCFLTGLSDEMRNDFRLMKEVARYTRIPPSQRQLALEDFIRNVNGNPEAKSILSDWGLKLCDANVRLPGRLLPPEEVYVGANVHGSATVNADWTRLATSNPCLSPININSWLVVCVKRDEQMTMEFISTMKKNSPAFGIRMGEPEIQRLPNDGLQSYMKSLQSLKGSRHQIVMIIFPVARADKYGAVKKFCCVEYPLPSQVILSRTIRNPSKLRPIAQKVVLQMNCKLGGTLWTVKIPLKNTMIVGIDTFHEKSKDSVGGVVASINPDFTRWYSRTYRQMPGLELIDGLEAALLHCLSKYKDVNSGHLPEQIIICRDGVGDGQLPVCQQHEVPQLLRAFCKISRGYEPKVLFLIVQKRISTRFFAKQGNDYQNPPPGSILDHTITRRYLYDFFLVSQNVREGTVSPSHYIVLHNSTSMSPDQVQRLCYKLTHLYYNWCGTVRVPAPCQYAHKLAYLVGDHIKREASEELADKLYYL